MPVFAVTALAAILRLASLAGSSTNPFYDAAVRSMSQSWHNFFFAAFEPAGGVSVDKPPVDLWLQVGSVKLFGFNPTALILPQAIAATLAVPLLYDLGRRLFGRPAGFAAALALAVMPISVETARSDTMDSLMMALNVLSAWLVVRAAQTGRLRFLWIGAAVAGLNFEVKLFEALLALPALAALYALGSREPLRRRASGLAVSLVITVAVALSWPAVVSLSPSSSRPFAIGSTNGSVWNAIFVYNGQDRVSPPTHHYYSPTPAPRPKAPRREPKGGSVPPPPPPKPKTQEIQGTISGYGAGPGPGRLFTIGGYHFGQDLGVELVGALIFGGLALLAGTLAELRRRTALRRAHAGLARTRAPAPVAPSGAAAAPIDSAEAPVGGEPGRASLPLPQAGALAVAVWLGICFLIFSRVKGVLHPRYLEAMTPAVTLALGAGLAVCIRLASTRVITLALLLASLTGTTIFGVRVAEGDRALSAITVAVAVAAGVAAAGALTTRRLRPRARRLAIGASILTGALCLVSILVPAAERSARIVQVNASDAGSPGAASPQWVAALSSYLKSHDGNARYELATASFGHAGPLIVHDGRPVLVLSSAKRRQVVSVATLAALARSGAVRYALIEGYCGVAPANALGNGCSPTVRWLRHRSVDVTTETGLHDRGVLFHITRPAAPRSG